MAIAFMRFNIRALVMVLGVDDHGQDQSLRVGRRKTGVAIRAPLHWSTYSIPIAQIDVVSHPDFIAIVNDWRSGKGKQQCIIQFDSASMIAKQRRKSPSNTQI